LRECLCFSIVSGFGEMGRIAGISEKAGMLRGKE